MIDPHQRGEGMLMQVGKEISACAPGRCTVESCSMGCASLVPSLLPVKTLIYEQDNL